jgi:hypothetical protein
MLVFHFWRRCLDDPVGHQAIPASNLTYVGQDADRESALSSDSKANRIIELVEDFRHRKPE